MSHLTPGRRSTGAQSSRHLEFYVSKNLNEPIRSGISRTLIQLLPSAAPFQVQTKSTMTETADSTTKDETTTTTTSVNTSIVDVTIHPLVLLSAADHYHRVARGTKKRVVGVLLGSVSRGNIDATNSFAVPFEEDSNNPVSRPSMNCFSSPGFRAKWRRKHCARVTNAFPNPDVRSSPSRRLSFTWITIIWRTCSSCSERSMPKSVWLDFTLQAPKSAQTISGFMI